MKGFVDRVCQECKYIFDSHVRNRNWSLVEVGRFWDSVADYDDINAQTYSYFRRFLDGYKLCDIPDGSYVLDICARTGNGAKYFYEQGKVEKVVCADVSEVFQNICRENLEKNGIPFDTVLFDRYELPFPENEFDAILCFETIEHFSQPLTFLQELYRLLKPGSQMVLTCPNLLWEPVHSLAMILNLHHSEGPHRFLTRKRLVSTVRDAGFLITKEVSTVIIPGGPETMTHFGEYLEESLPRFLVSLLALRRIIVCQKP